MGSLPSDRLHWGHLPGQVLADIRDLSSSILMMNERAKNLLPRNPVMPAGKIRFLSHQHTMGVLDDFRLSCMTWRKMV